MNITEEHRILRSDSPEIATQFQLEQVTHDFDLNCAILANDKGELLYASDAYDLLFYKVLAEASPALSLGNVNQTQWSKLNLYKSIQKESISSRSFFAGGDRYHIVAIGDAPTWREIGIFRAIRGLQRILKIEDDE